MTYETWLGVVFWCWVFGAAQHDLWKRTILFGPHFHAQSNVWKCSRQITLYEKLLVRDLIIDPTPYRSTEVKRARKQTWDELELSPTHGEHFVWLRVLPAKVSGMPAIISGCLPGYPTKFSGVTSDTRGVGRGGDGTGLSASQPRPESYCTGGQLRL